MAKTATTPSSKPKSVALKPLDDRIVIRPAAAEERTASGIYLPENAKEKPQQGTIVAAGPGKLSDKGVRTALSVKVGDTVLYGKYSGTEIEIGGEKLLITREGELLGVIEK